MTLQNLKNTNNRWIPIRNLVLAILAIALLIYILWQLRSVWRGPRIDIETPLAGSAVSSSLVSLRGSTDQVHRLLINGTIVPLQTDGDFAYTTSIGPGYSVVYIVGYDSHNKRSEQIEIPLFLAPVTHTNTSTTPPQS
jgi:hypothetical protein